MQIFADMPVADVKTTMIFPIFYGLESGIGHWGIVKFKTKKIALYYYDSLSWQGNEVMKSIKKQLYILYN